MSKKNIILLIIAGFIILIAWTFSLFLKSPTDNTGSGTGDSGGTNFVSEFFNTIINSQGENTSKEDDSINIDNGEAGEDVATEQKKAKLYKISSMPIAGYTLFKKEVFKYVPESTTSVDENKNKDTKNPKPTAPSTELVETLRYVAKTNGNIYQTSLSETFERRFSETVIPDVKESFFGDGGSSVVMRYLKGDGATIATFTGTLPKDVVGGDTAGENEILGSFLPENIKGLVVSPDGSKLFYMYSVKDIMVGMVSTFLGINKTQVFDSPFTEWIPQWPKDSLITITTKASGYVPGYMYAIDPNKKDLTKIFGGIKGLTTLTSSDGKKVLYNNNGLSINVYNIETGESSLLDVKTLPEKCVWGKDSIDVYCAVPRYIDNSLIYPDVWYQGEISFGDIIWKINTENKNKTLLIDPILLGNVQDMDITELMLDENTKNLFFVNKLDASLWGLELE